MVTIWSLRGRGAVLSAVPEFGRSSFRLALDCLEIGDPFQVPCGEGSFSMAYRRQSPPQMQAAAEQTAVAPTAPVATAKAPRLRMMRQYDLVERVRSYNPETDEDLLNRAYVYAMKAHGSQTRASGDPFFSHPLEVAAILTDLKLDDATIVAALLHDTIED